MNTGQSNQRFPQVVIGKLRRFDRAAYTKGYRFLLCTQRKLLPMSTESAILFLEDCLCDFATHARRNLESDGRYLQREMSPSLVGEGKSKPETGRPVGLPFLNQTDKNVFKSLNHAIYIMGHLES